MNINHVRRRFTSALCVTILGGAMFAVSGTPADAATLPNSDIVGSGAGAHFSPDGFQATLSIPPQCPGAHAAFSVTNLTLAKQTIEYYGGDVAIASGAEHIFCIGGTANDYEIEYDLLGTHSILHVDVP